MGARAQALLALLWFGSLTLCQLWWLTAGDYQGTYIWFAWVGLGVVMGGQFSALTWVVKRSSHALFLPAACWLVMEWSRLLLFSGYTWNPVGLSLTGQLLPRQMASLMGVYGLSFWVILTNTLAFSFLRQPHLLKRALLFSLAALFPYLFGFFHLLYHEQKMEREPPATLRALLLQPALLPDQKVQLHPGAPPPLPPIKMWEELLKEVERYRNSSIDLLLLPEYSFPYSSDLLLYEGRAAERLFSSALGVTLSSRWGHYSSLDLAQALAKGFDTPCILGLDHRDGEEVYNAALLFSPEGGGVQKFYGKRVLLPFAEYLPGEWARWLARRYGIVSFFTQGKGSVLMEGKGWKAAPSICYEEMFPHLMRENRLLGASLLLNLTNDGWYPNSRLPLEHFVHGRIRSVECGYPLLRACNTGITAAVDSLGRTVAMLGSTSKKDQFRSGALLVELPLYDYQTLYSLIGDGPLFGLSLLILLFHWGSRKRRERLILS